MISAGFPSQDEMAKLTAAMLMDIGAVNFNSKNWKERCSLRIL